MLLIFGQVGNGTRIDMQVKTTRWLNFNKERVILKNGINEKWWTGFGGPVWNLWDLTNDNIRLTQNIKTVFHRNKI